MLLLGAAALILTGACSRRPENVMSESKMADVLADLAIVEEISTQPDSPLETDSMTKVMRQSIMSSHGVTEAQFDATLAWYGHHMDEYSKLYDKVGARLAEREKAYSEEEQKTQEGSVNLWPLRRMISIGPNDAASGFSFSIPGSRIKKGDRIEWHFRLTDLEEGATAILAAEYGNFETTLTRRLFRENAPVDMVLQTDSSRVPRRIIGYIHLTRRPTRRVWVDSLSLQAFPYESDRYSAIHTHTKIFLQAPSSRRQPADSVRQPAGQVMRIYE